MFCRNCNFSTLNITLKLKQLTYVILFTLGITAITVHGFDSQEITEMVVVLPGLNSREMQNNLEVDIHKLPGIKFVETSLSSKTLILNYDSNKLSHQSIEHVLKKWDCNSGEFSFRNIVSMK